MRPLKTVTLLVYSLNIFPSGQVRRRSVTWIKTSGVDRLRIHATLLIYCDERTGANFLTVARGSHRIDAARRAARLYFARDRALSLPNSPHFSQRLAFRGYLVSDLMTSGIPRSNPQDSSLVGRNRVSYRAAGAPEAIPIESGSATSRRASAWHCRAPRDRG